LLLLVPKSFGQKINKVIKKTTIAISIKPRSITLPSLALPRSGSKGISQPQRAPLVNVFNRS
jgi:hypothetical protein